MRVMRCVPLLAAISLLSACGDGESPPSPPAAAAPRPTLTSMSRPDIAQEPANQTSVDGVRPTESGDTPPQPSVPVTPAVPTVPTVAGDDYILDRVDWLEPVVRQTTDPDFALTAARAVQIRALVRTAGADKSAPKVRINITNAAGARVGTGLMAGPATVRAGVSRASIADNYVFPLKALWIKPGLKVSIVVNPDGLASDPTPANNSAELAPAVNPEAVMYVTAVPVTTAAEGTALLPRSGKGEAATRAAIRATLMAMYPLSDVKVRLHAPYQLAGATTMRGNWALMLGEVNKLRIEEGKHGHYIGFIPHSPLGSTTTGNSFMPGTVATAMGAANPTAWRSSNVQHELGHNFGLGHVACAPIGADGEYGYDAEQNLIVPLAERNNVMSYCGPSWISTSDYVATQRKFTQSGLDKPDGVAIPLSEWK